MGIRRRDSGALQHEILLGLSSTTGGWNSISGKLKNWLGAVPYLYASATRGWRFLFFGVTSSSWRLGPSLLSSEESRLNDRFRGLGFPRSEGRLTGEP